MRHCFNITACGRPIGFAAAIAAGLAGWAGPATAQGDADTLVIAVPSDVQSWDPLATNSSPTMPILRSVFDAPLSQSEDLKLIPSIVESWEWADDGGPALKVKLREGVTFHNGEPLTTEDLKFSYVDRLRNDETLPFAGVFSAIEDIEILSDTEAVVHLKKQMPTLPNWWAFLGQFIVPKDYYESVGREGFIAKPVGSGPYKLKSYDRGSRIVLEAYDDYWNGAPKVRNLVFELVKDPSARAAAVQSGQADIAVNIPIREAVRLGETPGLVARIEPVSDIMIIHAKNEGAFTDENVRLAAHYGIDKEALSKAFFAGRAVPIAIPAAPSTPGYPDDFSVGYDSDKARELLGKSGFSPEKPVKIGFVTTNGAFPNDFEVARAIAGMWAQVGIAAEIEVVELPKYYQMSRGGQLPEATLFTWSNATDDPELYTGSILNPDIRFSVWKSADMGERLNPLLAEMDYDTRIEGYRDAAVYAIEHGYNIPLLQAVGTVVHAEDVDFTWFTNTWFEPYRIGKTD